MTFSSFLGLGQSSAQIAAAILLPFVSLAQNDPLSVATPGKVNIKRGETVAIPLKVSLKPGYHVNSNTPAEDYLIPLRLGCDAKPLEVEGTTFPKPVLEKSEFSKTPLSVFNGEFAIETRLKAPANAQPGLGVAMCKLRYQACTDKMCLPPKTVDVKLPLEVR